MNGAAKTGLVFAGYAAAVLLAGVVVTIHVWLTSGPDAQPSSGMYAFGDWLMFLAVFGVGAVLPTCAALYWLRPHRAFWVVLTAIGVAVAATALAAVILYSAGRAAPPGSALFDWSGIAVLRILMAPLLALAFCLAALFAPIRL